MEIVPSQGLHFSPGTSSDFPFDVIAMNPIGRPDQLRVAGHHMDSKTLWNRHVRERRLTGEISAHFLRVPST